MSTQAPLDLSALLDAERERLPPPGALERDFAKLTEALAQGVEPLTIGSASLQTGASLLAKVAGSVAIGAVVGVSAAGGAHYASAPTATPAASTRAARPLPAQVVERTGPLETPTPSEAPPPAEATQEGATGITPGASREASSAPTTDQLDAGFDAELELIESAKKDVDAGQPHLAAVWLAEHARRYPSGVFVQERRALQVLVACAQRSEQGSRLAADFVRMYPGSAFADRVKRACQAPASEPARKNFEGTK